MFSVLFVADARMSFDNYRSCMVATSDSKTIFTVNPGIISRCIYIHQTSIHCIRASLLPVTIIHVFHSDTDTQEAHSLYQYAQQCDSTEEPEDDSRSDPPCMYSINSHPFMFHILISLFNLYLLIYICGLFFYHNLDKFKITKV